MKLGLTYEQAVAIVKQITENGIRTKSCYAVYKQALEVLNKGIFRL